MKNEPAVKIGSVTAVVSALLALLAVFGLHLSADQQTAVVGFLVACGPVVAAFITRAKVTPVAAQIEGD